VVFCIYADIFVCEFCLVATKHHQTVVITKCIHSIQNNNTFIVQEIYWRRERIIKEQSIITYIDCRRQLKWSLALYLNICCNVIMLFCVWSATIVRSIWIFSQIVPFQCKNIHFWIPMHWYCSFSYQRNHTVQCPF